MTNSKLPMVSVLMSVYNGEMYLRQAVQSVLDQTFRDFEFTIVNDGSTDSTANILMGYAAQDSRIRIVETRNQGLTKCLNLGLSYCRGAFIARLDADDVAVRDRFERQVTFFRCHSSCGCVGTFVTIIDDCGRKLFVRPLPESHEEICEAHLMGYGSMIVHPSIMMARAALDFAKGYDESYPYAQDYDLWCRMAVRYRLANINVSRQQNLWVVSGSGSLPRV